VIAVAVGLEAGGVEHIADRAGLALRIHVGLAQAVAAAGDGQFDRWRPLAVTGK
jgi:hypothetical protein